MGKTHAIVFHGRCVFTGEMILPFLLAVAGIPSPDQYSQAIPVAQPIRLELTPTLDGTLAKEEWDPYGEGTFMQWEPGRIHVAAQMPAGKDLVLSIDAKGDGWLVGRDNYEFRVTMLDGKPVIVTRELDCTAVKEPVWRDRADLKAACDVKAIVAGDLTTIEATFDDAGQKLFPRTPRTVSMRLNVVDSGEAAAYWPRTCMRIRFDDHRSVALPEGMKSDVQASTRSVVPGEKVKLRFTFKGANSMGANTIDVRSLGDAEAAANRLSLIFPGFDPKGRAIVDYATAIAPSALPGYRLVRGTIGFKDGPAGLVEASYRIAPYLDFTLLRSSFDRLPENNTLRIPYVLQMYTHQPAEGLTHITPPAGWQVTRGDKAKFSVFGNQSADSRQFEVRAPADVHGTFPIEITAELKDRRVSQLCYVTIR